MPIGAKFLQLGDILITAADNTVSHCGIVAGTTTINAASGKIDRADMVCHATSKGIKTDAAAEWANRPGGVGVFRMRGLNHISSGGKPATKRIAEAATFLASHCHYSPGRAVFKSWLTSSEYGSGAQGRLKKYLAKIASGQPLDIAVYCSEFVVLSYQFAANGDSHAAYFIDLDAKHTLPKDLRTWLLQRARGGSWQVLGNLVP